MAVVSFIGEFLLKSFEALCRLLILVLIPGELAASFVYDLIFYVGHNFWSHSLDCNFDLVRWYFYHWASRSRNHMCGICCTGRTFPLWVVVMSPGIPWIIKVCSCSLSSNNFEAPVNGDNQGLSDMSISGQCGNGSVMWSHLMEVIWVKPQWCLVKHLCSYIFVQFM